jgi:hypothetical protein
LLPLRATTKGRLKALEHVIQIQPSTHVQIIPVLHHAAKAILLALLFKSIRTFQLIVLQLQIACAIRLVNTAELQLVANIALAHAQPCPEAMLVKPGLTRQRELLKLAKVNPIKYRLSGR